MHSRDEGPVTGAATTPVRAVRLTGALNVRDLGGLPAAGGRRTRFGALLRADMPGLLDEGDARTLVDDFGLRTVVDLRTRGEVRHQPGSWLEHGVAWIHCPVHLGDMAPVPAPDSDHVAAYTSFLDADPRALLMALSVLMDGRSRPALFHCAAGKDRTGVTAALLLDVLGVPISAIADDYALTEAALERVLARLADAEPYRRTLAGAVAADHVPHAHTMQGFLEGLHERHGGAEGWLLSQGVEAVHIAGFRDAMLEPAPDPAATR